MIRLAEATGNDLDKLPSGRSLKSRFDAIVAAEFATQPMLPSGGAVTRADLEALPDPVRRYVTRSGAVGRPRPQNMRVVMDANMYRSPGQAPMRARSVQFSFFGRPTRIFLMQARMFGLPVRALHVYREEAATFTVRVASTVNMVDLSGPEISAAETVTVLNDMCLMAPGALLDPRLTWSDIDDRAARVHFTNGPHRVRATLQFNDDDELINFWSDDRPDSSNGHFTPMRWSTPVSEHGDFGGMHLLRRGGAVYERPEGPFMYGDFTLSTVDFDVPDPTSG